MHTQNRPALSDAKRALLEKRLRGEAQGAAARMAIPRRAGDGPAPLSFAQEHLWFFEQMEPGKAFYHLPGAIRLYGRVNVPALEQAVNEVVWRHEALRTVFPSVDGKPVQVVLPEMRVKVPVVEVPEVPGEERDATLRRMIVEESARPFDIERGPLVRAKLFRVSETEHAFLHVIHHLVSDGWSQGLFSRELSDHYGHLAQGEPAPELPPLPIQYTDFAAWQREYLTGGAVEKELAYWRQQLEGAPTLEFPTDRPRPAVQTYRGAFHRFAIEETMAEALRGLARREGMTLNMTMMAAFYAVAHHWTGQDDLVVGTLLGGRSRPETEWMIGYFVNPAALRADLSGDPPFREVMRRVRNAVLDADAHQDLPFEHLVDELKAERSLSRHPLFQVMFFLHTFVRHNEPVERGENLDLVSAPLDPVSRIGLVDTGTTKFDLNFAMLEVPGYLSGLVEYSTDLFDDATMQRLVVHFKRVLEQGVADPDVRLSGLRLLTDEERAELLRVGSPGRSCPAAPPLHEIFSAQAGRTPDSPALSFEGRTVSYAELERRSNQLAHLLRERDVGPEVRVGICMQRGVEMVVALLGVLKAGGAYVPLDPAYPQERLGYMQEDARIRLVITESSLAGRLPAQADLLCLDEVREELHRLPYHAPRSGVLPENLSHVIFTSGSTGRPKGVMIRHSSTVVLLHWLREIVTDEERSAVLGSTSINFDVSVAEIFGTLCWGGTLYVVENALELATFPEREKIRYASMVPTAAGELMRMGGIPAGVRTLNLGGEALPHPLAQALHALGTVEKVGNLYGPTEDTTYSTYSLVEKGGSKVYVGRPVANTHAYVLDGQLNPVPVGVIGELYLSGDGLARGYVSRPELTAERFLPDPFGPAGGRMYRVMDRVRWTAGGELEYFGRMDHQVKVRGFRIELGEIEAALLRHPGVREAVVLMREDAPGDRRLVAYVVAEPEHRLEGAGVRALLKEALPGYMVPSAVVFLQALPLTPNGKVDRRALPVPDGARPEMAEHYVAPGAPVEQALAEIWAQVLGLERVGVHDNFFELGGDSILTIQVIARANAAGLRLSPKHLFQYHTIAELAAVAGTSRAVEAEQGPVVGPVPLTPIQHWFFEKELPAPHHWNQSFLLEVREPVDPALLERAVEALLVHHDALRFRYPRSAGGWEQQGTAPGEPVPYEWRDLSALSPEAQSAAIERDAAALQASLDLARGPLVRVALFDCGAGRPARLLLVVHHLAVDGVSWRILLEDLETAYRQLRRSEEVRLPAKTTSFRQWAERLKSHADSGEPLRQLAYWLDEPRSRVAPLPVDTPAAANTEASRRVVTVSLPREETRALLQEVPAAYGTQINDVLLTALARTLSRWTGEHSLLVDLEGHGREALFDEVDLSRTVGWFTSIYPVHLEIEPGAGPGESLKAVKEQLRRIPEQGIGYGILRYLCTGEDAVQLLHRMPPAEVSFNYLGQFDSLLGGNPLFAGASESAGPSHALEGPRAHLLEIDGHVAGGELHLVWSYGDEVHRRSTVERLAAEYLEALRELIEHCRAPQAGGYTPSDFPEAALSQDELDDLLTEFS